MAVHIVFLNALVLKHNVNISLLNDCLLSIVLCQPFVDVWSLKWDACVCAALSVVFVFEGYYINTLCPPRLKSTRRGSSAVFTWASLLLRSASWRPCRPR